MILECSKCGHITSTISNNPRCSKCQGTEFMPMNPQAPTPQTGTQPLSRVAAAPSGLEKIDTIMANHFERLSKIQLMNAMSQGHVPQPPVPQQPASSNDKMFDLMKEQNERMFDIMEDNMDDREETPADDSPENILISAVLAGMKKNPDQAKEQIHTHKDKIAEYIATHPKQAQKIGKDNPELAKIIMSELKP